MGFFKKPKHCVFSAVSGHLTLNGEPVKNARLVRTGQLGHAKSEATDEAVTDENGYFEFPDMYQSASELGGVAHFVIFQHLKVIVKDSDPVTVWFGKKYDGLSNSEARGELMSISCELSQEDSMIYVAGNVYHTKCTWNVIPDEPSVIGGSLLE